LHGGDETTEKTCANGCNKAVGEKASTAVPMGISGPVSAKSTTVTSSVPKDESSDCASNSLTASAAD
jgi:hypothetical protein